MYSMEPELKHSLFIIARLGSIALYAFPEEPLLLLAQYGLVTFSPASQFIPNYLKFTITKNGLDEARRIQREYLERSRKNSVTHDEV